MRVVFVLFCFVIVCWLLAVYDLFVKVRVGRVLFCVALGVGACKCVCVVVCVWFVL